MQNIKSISIKCRIIIISTILQLFIISLSFAGDGQIDILPDGKATFIISKSGSYILNGDVTMTANVTCINITVSDVTIDLNGHTITGTGSGSANGIIGLHNIVIYNGRIENFSQKEGISLMNNAAIHDVIVRACKIGINVTDNCNLKNIFASENTNIGIQANDGGIIEKCSIMYNCTNPTSLTGAGIYVGNKMIIRDCSVVNNGTSVPTNNIYGIFCKNECQIINNNCSGNTFSNSGGGVYVAGIYSGYRCLIQDNNCSGNYITSGNGYVYGIYTQNYSKIIGNNCSDNKGFNSSGTVYVYGIFAYDNCLIQDNNVSKNIAYSTSTTMAVYGINISDYCYVKGNCVTENKNTDDNKGYGIYSGGNSNRIEGNQCVNHLTGISLNTGKSDCVVRLNTTSGNTEYGIYMGNGAHYCAENITSEATGITATTGVTLGTGDRANINY